jgi:cellulose synthase/poly-beta-1,6-N-acetylglucosamine synthase-like glycosyltransferase
MIGLFWLSLFFITFTYAWYPGWLYLRMKRRPCPVQAAPILPTVSILMAVHNEAMALPAKLKSLEEIDYRRDLHEIVVVSDGSTDRTNQILSNWASERHRVIICDSHRGKATALNRAMQEAKGEILVFTDARQQIEPAAVKCLAANFADPAVGCVSGELMLDSADGSGGGGEGLGLYWRLEKKIREWESRTGSVVGATGAFYAIRRDLAVPLPPAAILDDVYLPMQAARKGKRVIFEPAARVFDSLATPNREFRRKVRTLTGNYQLLQLAPWLLTRENPIRFEFICHKVFRLLIPFALGTLLLSSLLLPGYPYRLALMLQVLFYALAALGAFPSRLGVVSRLANVALGFLMLNTAAAVAFLYFVTGRKTVWQR